MSRQLGKRNCQHVSPNTDVSTLNTTDDNGPQEQTSIPPSNVQILLPHPLPYRPQYIKAPKHTARVHHQFPY